MSDYQHTEEDKRRLRMMKLVFSRWDYERDADGWSATHKRHVSEQMEAAGIVKELRCKTHLELDAAVCAQEMRLIFYGRI